jgi:L,D-peptidoglycan transpeptidase YkuD (ErfK/YbiS/YcfS/YnhG family)
VKAEDLVINRRGARFLGRQFPCVVGRGGIVPAHRKREGDGATPDGTHRIVGALYRPDRMARPMDWALPIGPVDLWSDDPKDPDYNTMVRAPHGFSHERLRRADPLYDLILLTDWNWPMAVPGRGSAIFLHRWRRPHSPTAGCVGFAPQDLLWIAQRLTYDSRLIVRGD